MHEYVRYCKSHRRAHSAIYALAKSLRLRLFQYILEPIQLGEAPSYLNGLYIQMRWTLFRTFVVRSLIVIEYPNQLLCKDNSSNHNSYHANGEKRGVRTQDSEQQNEEGGLIKAKSGSFGNITCSQIYCSLDDGGNLLLLPLDTYSSNVCSTAYFSYC